MGTVVPLFVTDDELRQTLIDLIEEVDQGKIKGLAYCAIGHDGGKIGIIGNTAQDNNTLHVGIAELLRYTL